VAALARATEEEVLSLWQGLGYYGRARNLLAAAREVVGRFGGAIPRDAGALRSLPGLGEYAAGAVASFAFDEPVPAIDGNVARVLARLGDIRARIDGGEGRRALRQFARDLLPARGAGRFNAALMELGATLCLPGDPDCARCPAKRFCRTPDPASLPLKKPALATEWIEERCLFAVRGEAVLLRKETGKRWGGLWKLPPWRGGAGGTPVWEGVYPFTHHRVRLSVFAGRPHSIPEGAEWVPLDSVGSIPVAAAHRRALRALLPPEPSAARRMPGGGPGHPGPSRASRGLNRPGDLPMVPA
jgi:A/G-specific adenine glycosylase